MKKIVIAIDGHSSSGKSTMAKDLAREIGYIYIDTGAMYRAVTYYSLQHGFIKDGVIDEKSLASDMDKIRGMQVADNVSLIAALSFVRKAMVAQQQEMGKEKGIVMDGRDIGIVVFPNAELKLFVTASPEVRARRRVDELVAKGENASYEEVLENVKKRDYLDSTRAESPLRQAPDAIVLDNSNMTIAEQKAWLLQQVKNKIND